MARATYKAKPGVSKLGRDLRRIREKIEASGENMLTRRELEREIAGRRGQRGQTGSGTHAILRRVMRMVSIRSILAISPRSERVPKVDAVPRAPARPVLPTRWMKSSGTCGRS